MAARATLLGITFTSNEIATAQENGQDLVGLNEMAAQAIADAMEKIKAMQDFIPGGSNATTLATVLSTIT